MDFRVSAINKAGGAVSVIVHDAATALAKLVEYREDGFTEINVKDLEGRDVRLDEFPRPGAPVA